MHFISQTEPILSAFMCFWILSTVSVLCFTYSGCLQREPPYKMYSKLKNHQNLKVLCVVVLKFRIFCPDAS